MTVNGVQHAPSSPPRTPHPPHDDPRRHGRRRRPISPDVFGAFFEDINHAADGGLYAELVQNRPFAYSRDDRPEWHALTPWEPLERGGGRGSPGTDTAAPLHPDNPPCGAGSDGPGRGSPTW